MLDRVGVTISQKLFAVGFPDFNEYINAVLDNKIEEIRYEDDALETDDLYDNREHYEDFKEWPQQYKWWLEKWKKALEDINEKP